MNDHPADRFRIIKAIAWIYLMLGSAFAGAALVQVEFHGLHLQPVDAVLPALMALGAIGTLLRQQWGRYISYFFSAVLLLGVPVGTFLGFVMISRLTRDRDLFSKP